MCVLRFVELAMHKPPVPQNDQPQEGLLPRQVTPHAAPVRRLPVLVGVGCAAVCLSA